MLDLEILDLKIYFIDIKLFNKEYMYVNKLVIILLEFKQKIIERC